MGALLCNGVLVRRGCILRCKRGSPLVANERQSAATWGANSNNRQKKYGLLENVAVEELSVLWNPKAPSLRRDCQGAGLFEFGRHQRRRLSLAHSRCVRKLRPLRAHPSLSRQRYS